MSDNSVHFVPLVRAGELATGNNRPPDPPEKRLEEARLQYIRFLARERTGRWEAQCDLISARLVAELDLRPNVADELAGRIAEDLMC